MHTPVAWAGPPRRRWAVRFCTVVCVLLRAASSLRVGGPLPTEGDQALPAIVAVWSPRIADDVGAPSSPVRCTGTFIAPEVVVTAASCLLSRQPQGLVEQTACAYGHTGCPLVSSTSIQLLDPSLLPTRERSLGSVVGISFRYSDPSRTPELCVDTSACGRYGWNLAVLRVVQSCEPRLECIEPLPMAVAAVDPGARVRVVGAGISDPAQPASYQLRALTATVRSVDDGHLLRLQTDAARLNASVGAPPSVGAAPSVGAPPAVGAAPAVGANASVDLNAAEGAAVFAPLGGVCEGDAGAPVLRIQRSRFELVGILSHASASACGAPSLPPSLPGMDGDVVLVPIGPEPSDPEAAEGNLAGALTLHSMRCFLYDTLAGWGAVPSELAIPPGQVSSDAVQFRLRPEVAAPAAAILAACAGSDHWPPEAVRRSVPEGLPSPELVARLHPPAAEAPIGGVYNASAEEGDSSAALSEYWSAAYRQRGAGATSISPRSGSADVAHVHGGGGGGASSPSMRSLSRAPELGSGSC